LEKIFVVIDFSSTSICVRRIICFGHAEGVIGKMRSIFFQKSK